MSRDLLTSDFDFDLPSELIAQSAVEPRDHARLLHVTPSGFVDRQVRDLPGLLRADDFLVLNDTKVIPARFYGQRGTVRVEVMLHKKQSGTVWLAFARPGKRLKEGDRIVLGDGFHADILEKREGGEIAIRFNVIAADVLPMLQRFGEPPLPPYIHRREGEARQDSERYQTVYAKREGAVAAPTAGLHFTSDLFEMLRQRGIETATVTLHVGAGTFLPVKAERLADHRMHAEWGEIDAATVERIRQAKRAGRRIVAVGTTSLRLLESAADVTEVIRPMAGDTSIFIYPGYKFKVVDVLMTNFHLPRSTLFMLVAAFAGRERMLDAYKYAIAQKYRFYSYGDATLLEKA